MKNYEHYQKLILQILIKKKKKFKTQKMLLFLILVGCSQLTNFSFLFGPSRGVPNFNPIRYSIESYRRHRHRTDRHFCENRFF